MVRDEDRPEEALPNHKEDIYKENLLESVPMIPHTAVQNKCDDEKVQFQ